jgi:hypothetical protein
MDSDDGSVTSTPVQLPMSENYQYLLHGSVNFDGQCVFSDGDPFLQMLSTNTIHPVKHTHQYIQVIVGVLFAALLL